MMSTISAKLESPPRTRPSIDELDRLFRPRSVAIVGASPIAGTARNSLVRVLMKHGFPGEVFPVNPKQHDVEGMACYPSLEALPKAPDLAMIMTPAETVPGLIRECGDLGIRAAIVFSSGFEDAESGKKLAIELAAAARASGVTMLGPNCQGIWSIREKTMLTFGPAARRLEKLLHSSVAVVSQSGALGGAIANHFQAAGIGSSYIISVGNETTTDMLDGLRWVIEQDDVKTAVLYIEGLEDGAEILRLVERARERGVQIVALKAGISAMGQAATASHTGKIASAGSVYRDVFEQAGIILVDSLLELMTTVKTLQTLPDPRVSGDLLGGIAVVSTSGGACALLADHCEQDGVPMASFSENVAAQLAELLPDFARTENPVDVTGQIRAVPDLLKKTLTTISEDVRTEVIVLQLSSSGQSDVTENQDDIRRVAEVNKIPVVVSLAGEVIDEADVRRLRDGSVLTGFDPAASIRAVKRIYQRQSYTGRAPAETRKANGTNEMPRDWPSVMRYLADSGIEAPGWAILGPGESAENVCRNLAYPLVVKALPDDAEHKTELGLIRLGIASPADVDRHATQIRERLGAPESGVLVQEMAGDGVEVVLSCLRNTDFGPIINIGLGGIAVELFRDIGHLALPVDQAQVRAAIKRLKLWEVLQGFRGKPRADIDALIAATVALGDKFIATPGLMELEINPLVVLPQGQGLLALDALLTTDS